MSSLRDDLDKFAAFDSHVIAINPASAEAHEKYRQQKDFNFPLLSDSERAVAKAYHALKENGTSIQRSVYIIDKQGTIRFAEQGMPADEKLLETVKSFET